MLIQATILALLMVLTACQSNEGKHPSLHTTRPITAVTVGPGPFAINSVIPYQNEHAIQLNIRQECNLGQQLSEHIAAQAQERGIPVHRTPHVDSKGTGKVLIIEITNAISMGNAFIGHSKATSVQGNLYENGILKGSFTGGRRSMGGAFAGFKGSCSVLGRTVKVLGEDISGWLQQPMNNAHLGDH